MKNKKQDRDQEIMAEKAPVKEKSAEDSLHDTKTSKKEVQKRMKEAVIFLERGDYAKAGELLDELSNDSGLTQEEQERVEELLERMKPDPVAVWIGVGCLLVIAVLAITTLGH